MVVQVQYIIIFIYSIEHVHFSYSILGYFWEIGFKTQECDRKTNKDSCEMSLTKHSQMTLFFLGR